MHVYKNSDNEFEVSMEVEDGFDDDEIFEALLATAMKYATCLLYTSPSPRD